ncbi:Helicase protein MOM1 [Carex littledalei]|uniref:Helicase protein MOM1 n=1 Tax=Carex littledalei TaxID=544730 RepID=A0A833RK46_9POAL|nr:Helicase protein MOM1 [Carex littledalei]
MVKTRSKGKKGDKKSRTDANLAAKKPNSNDSNSNKKSSVSRSNTINPSPLRRSTRETPTKKKTQLSGTTTTLSPSTKEKNPTSNSMKSVSGGSGSSAKTHKKKSKGKEKALEEEENSKTGKRDLSSSSPLNENEKEENSLAKRRRLHMNAKRYKELFMPRSKIYKPSPTVEKAEAVEAPVNTDLIVDDPVEKASCMREYSSGSKSTKEATPYAPEANSTMKVSENNAEEHVISVEEARAESTSDEMECEVLSAPPCKADDLPVAGSTAERKVDLEAAVIARDDAIDISEQHQAGEIDSVPNTCLTCRKPGVLLCCEGKNCKRTYHLSCLDPPLLSNPPGAWLCVTCIQKRIQFGVYAVCGGIENIWDVKDAGSNNGKLYLVKYKNLAHVHNRWVPEAEIAIEAPELLLKFNTRMHRDKRNPLKWKQEWTEPQRLLMKRPLMPERAADEFYDGPGDSLPFSNAEWLVKWRDLGYEHATWELETSPFLCTEEGTSLIKAFESRRQQARLSSYPQRINRALEVKQSPFERLEKLPDLFPPGLNSEHLHSVNQLRLFWHKSQNAIFIDEQERVIKTILFIMLVIEDICRPIIIVSSAGSLPLWESKFQRLAPNINVVSYTGTKPVRKLMRDFEFYEETGCVMFQVLLSHPDAILEDFEMLDAIGCETVIVDECQNSRISKYLEKFKNLSCDFRLLLLSSPLRDNLSEYVNMLSYLDPNHDISNNNLSKSDMLAHCKEKLGHHLAYERKEETSKVMEYWVPARFSKVQLELYCSTLLSNSFALRSSSRNDQVGALRDMLISLRKCCDHPYLVYQDLQVALTKERPLYEILNIGVYASGKLLLLDKLLHEMKARGLRVLIVFQSGGGSGRNQIGDFLDDFLRQRFGAEAYEHVERGLLMSKKQIAMNNFNDKSKGRFVFLIENRACQPSLKLSAVDAVLIYDSDWNPMNDTRNLQRINMKPERVPVFRFYSPCAVEEKVLSLAKQDVFLDSTLQGVVPTVSHSLLSWGAERLFSQLHELHLQPDDALENYRSSYVSPEDTAFVDAVMTEIMDKVSGKSNAGANSAASLLVEAQLSGEFYSHDSGPLIGEKEGVASLHGDPPVFWSGLLEGKNPQWRFIQSDGPLQRNRRKVRPFDNSEKPLVAGPSGRGETEESRKKKKKNGVDTSMAGTGIVSPRGKTGTNASARNSPAAVSTWDDFSGISAGPSQQEISNQAGALASVEVGANLRSMQKDLHLLFEPQLLNLCQSAGLPDYVKTMAGMLLEYVMNNFKVDNGGDAAILQTLVISLCWRAASLFKHWVDPLQLTALASEKLQYNCKADIVESVYCRLKVLKVEFQEKADAMLAGQIPAIRFYNKLFKVPKQEVITLPETPSSDEEIIDTPAPMPVQNQTANETEVEQENTKEKLLNAQLDLIEKVSSRRVEALLTKQEKEVTEMEQFKEREAMQLTKEHQSQLERYSGSGMEEKVREVKEEFERKMRAFEAHMETERKRLQELHMAARELERSIKEDWVQNAKLGNLEDDFENVPLSDCGEFIVQEFKWYAPTPPLVQKNNLSESDGDGDIASGPSNHTPSPPLEETGVVAVVAQGDAAAELTAQHRDVENTIMEQETQSVAESTTPVETAESTLPVETAESTLPAETAESTLPAETAESTLPAETAESTLPAETAESALPAETAELTPPTEAIELTPPTAAETAESALPAETAESALPAETAELTPPTEAVESAPRAEAVESAPRAEAVESTPRAEAVESTPHAEAARLTPSLTAVTLPAVVDVAVANGDNTMAYTSDAHCFPQQSRGTVPQNPVALHVPFQNASTQNVGSIPQNGSEENYNDLWQMLPLASPIVFPHGLHADPLKNELARIKHQENILARRDEARRLQLKMLMEEEMEVLNRKYEEMVREHENTYRHQKQQLADVYKKVLLNQSLAEEFRAKFIEHRTVPSASPSTSASSHLRNHVTQRPQMPPQHRVPQQIQRAPAPPAAAAPRQGSVSVNANGSLRPPSVATLHIPSTSSPLRPSAPSPNPNRATFSPVTLPPRPGPPLRTAPAPHLARARPHMSATVLSSTSTPAPGSVAVTPLQQLKSLFARSQEGLPSQTQTQTQSQNFLMESLTPSLREVPAAVSQTQTQTQNQNQPVESFGNGSGFGLGQVMVGDDVVYYLSDDD